MATVLSIDKLAYLFDGCPSVCQQYRFPGSLLCYLREVCSSEAKATSKYNFVMPLAEFNCSLKEMFIQKETTYYTEHFYDVKEGNSLMQNNIWFKLIQHDDGTCLVSIKRTKHLDNGVIEYQEKVMEFDDACKKIPGLITLLNGEKYAIEVQRTKYVHKNNEKVILTLDKATYEDDSSFVVFSLIADFENANNKHHEIAIHSCRSKIIELISKVKPNLYNYLIEHGDVKDIDYKSMSEAEFEAGPEEAMERKKLAESEKERMIKENEKLENEDKYSTEHIRMWYRSVLKYGLFKFDDDN